MGNDIDERIQKRRESVAEARGQGTLVRYEHPPPRDPTKQPDFLTKELLVPAPSTKLTGFLDRPPRDATVVEVQFPQRPAGAVEHVAEPGANVRSLSTFRTRSRKPITRSGDGS